MTYFIFIIFIFRFGPLILSDRTAVWTCSWWTVSYWPHAVHWVIWKEMFTTKNQTALVMLGPLSQTCFTAGISGKCFMHFVFCIKHILNMIIVSYDTLSWLWFIYYRECEGSDSLLETWGWHKGHQAAAGSWTDPSEWPLTHHHPAHAGQTAFWCLYQVFERIGFLIRYFLYKFYQIVAIPMTNYYNYQVM